jgi:hypothetical protein
MSSRGNSLEPDTRFAGYGDRVGSGVELAPATWRGGEIVTDKDIVVKSLSTIKPRRMFYSPIGDGVVAADGIEMKRAPPDLQPRVEIIQQRHVEKGHPGQAGRRVIEKTWTSGGGPGAGGASNYGSEYGGGSGRDSRATNAASPFGSLADPLGMGSTGLGGGAGGPPQQQPGSGGAGGPGTSGYGAQPNDPFASNYNTLGSRDPYSTLGSTKSAPVDNRGRSQDPLNGFGDNYGSGLGGGPNAYPPSGRSSTTSAMTGEPGMRYEIDRYQRVANPRELIHQYATTTPITTIDGYEQLPGGGTVTRTIKQSYSNTTEETYAPYPPYAAGANAVNPNKFVRQLRDETLTSSQRAANQNLQPLNSKDTSMEQRIREIEHKVSRQVSPNPDVDQLTNRLKAGLQTKLY